MLRISRCCAVPWTAWGFRTLRSATTGSALWKPATFEKVDETFILSY